MITGGEDKCIPVPYYVRRRVAILSILKLRAEAGLRPKTPVIDSLMSGFAWLVGIMLVRWVAGPAHLIHVKLGVLKLGLRERDPVRNLVRDRFAGLQPVGERAGTENPNRDEKSAVNPRQHVYPFAKRCVRYGRPLLLLND